MALIQGRSRIIRGVSAGNNNCWYRKTALFLLLVAIYLYNWHQAIFDASALQPSSSSSLTSSETKIKDLTCSDPSISFLEIAAVPANPPRILCLILSHSGNHQRRVKPILETWGRRCDKLIVASNQTDASVGAVSINSQDGYWGIWDKLVQSLRHVQQAPEYRQNYDWILKVDDDSYVIMENLKSFLATALSKQELTSESLIFGRTMPWPKLKDLAQFPGWFQSKGNKAFGKRFFEKFQPSDTLVYAHGGPGYVMNWKYVDLLVQVYEENENVVKGRLSEDLANAATMMYHNVVPKSTFDVTTQRERSHPEPPMTMYDNPEWLPWMQKGAEHFGDGPHCCSPTSISYHHVKPHLMRMMEYQLYECPRSVHKV